MSPLTMWQFWVGTGWGFALGSLAVWHCLVKPMAELLGWEDEPCGSAPGTGASEDSS